MLEVLQVASLVLVVIAMIPAVAHALELPGKLRLTKDAYIAVQPIYYPGFTIVGFSEPIAIVVTIVLLILTPRQNADFWLTLIALLGLVAMHAVYWLVTHPVNNFWLKDEKLSAAATSFFSRRNRGSRGNTVADWTKLRDRWEHSHVWRAAFAALSFIALVIAVSSATGA